jgi:hypothetical protein
VKRGFETGLMLGYIPAETDGKVHSEERMLRQAATIVYEPLADPQSAASYLPADWADLIRQLAKDCGLPRSWLVGAGEISPAVSQAEFFDYPRRRLARLTVTEVGADLDARVQQLNSLDVPCLQLDLLMNDPALAAGATQAASHGFVFCGWLPGYRRADVLRLQRVDPALTDMNPGLVNPTAQTLLKQIVS